MRTIETTVYLFSELSEDAKERAIENLCDINVDFDWWEFSLDQFEEELETFGGYKYEKKFYFDIDRGSYVSFSYNFSLADFLNEIEKIKYNELPPDLHNFCDNWKTWANNIRPMVKKLILNGDVEIYTHARHGNRTLSTYFGYHLNGCHDTPLLEKYINGLASDFEDILIDFENVFLRRLRDEYECLTSKETIIETIEANEYEFTADGKLV